MNMGVMHSSPCHPYLVYVLKLVESGGFKDDVDDPVLLRFEVWYNR